MRTRDVLAACLFVSLLSVAVSAGRGTNVLVILEDLQVKSTHSILFSHLRQLGYQLEYRAADDKKLQIRDWDSWLFDKIICFAAAVPEFGGAVDTQALLEFVDSGRDLLLAVDSNVSEELRDLSAGVGVDLEPKGRSVIDHFSYALQTSAVDHSVIAGQVRLATSAVLGETPKAPVLFRGIGASIPPDSELALKVLTASSTAISAVPGKLSTEAPSLAGNETTLVAAVQTRNNARVVVSGSIALFSNEFIRWSPLIMTPGQRPESNSLSLLEPQGPTLSLPWQDVKVRMADGKWTAHTKEQKQHVTLLLIGRQPGSCWRPKRTVQTGNRAVATQLAEWTFQERGRLRVSKVRHVLAGSTETPQRYRVKDEVDFSVDIHEWRQGSWQPYKADDVQVEFVMLHPYLRLTLGHNNQGTFSKRLRVPDVYGVFKFVLDYQRPGYTHLFVSEQAPVRPFKHDEYERFIPAAYPYYASTFSMMAGFLALTALFLYHK